MSADSLQTVTSDVGLMNYLFAEFADTKDKQRRLLDGVSISLGSLSHKRTQITAFEEHTFLSNISKLKGDDWVWRHVDLWKPKAEDDLGKAVMYAPNCGEALNIITQFGHLLGPNLFFEQFVETTKIGARRILTLGMVSDVDEIRVNTTFQRDLMMLRIYYMLDQVMGKVWSGSEIRYRGDVNVSANVYKNMFKCTVVKNQARNGFFIPVEFCEKPSKIGNPTAFRKAVVSLHQGKASPASENAFRLRVANYLAAISNGRPSSIEAATNLGVSLRTLNRKLRDNGTSFRELLEASLKRRANFMMDAKNMSHAQISDRLGFKDQASFSRALKRWRQSK